MATHLMSALWLWHVVTSLSQMNRWNRRNTYHHLFTTTWKHTLQLANDSTHNLKTHTKAKKYYNGVTSRTWSTDSKSLIIITGPQDPTPKSFFWEIPELPTWQNTQARLALRSLRSLTLAFRLTLTLGHFWGIWALLADLPNHQKLHRKWRRWTI